MTDIREEFARIAESRRKPLVSASNIGYNCALDEMIAELRALPSVCGGEVDEIKRLKVVIERDRSRVAEVVTDIRKAMTQHEWLRLGRGSYEYDDDRWKDEFGEAFDNIEAELQHLRRIAGDLSDSPTNPAEIAAARRKINGPSPESIHNAIAAMEPFAKNAELVTGDMSDNLIFGLIGDSKTSLRVGHFRKLALALAALKREVG